MKPIHPNEVKPIHPNEAKPIHPNEVKLTQRNKMKPPHVQLVIVELEVTETIQKFPKFINLICTKFSLKTSFNKMLIPDFPKKILKKWQLFL